jgi:hypothetical protein
VWLENQGWVRVDPTAAVSPERIEQGIGDALRDSDELPLLVRPNFPLLKKAFLSWDSVNNGWNQWVLGYDDKKQLEFLSKLSGKKLNMQDMLMWMIGAIALVMTLTTFILIKKTKVKLNPVQQLYAQFLNKLKPAQLVPNVGEGALDFAVRASTKLPNQAAEILAIAQRFNALQYSQHASASLIKQLQQCIEQFKLNA